jgi:hypothetical protein
MMRTLLAKWLAPHGARPRKRRTAGRPARRSRPPRAVKQSPSLRPPLRLEPLEDRTLPSGSPAAAAYGQLPLSFEANQGQSAPQVSFLAHGPSSTLFLTGGGGAVLALGPGGSGPGDVLDLQLLGANPSPAAAGQGLLPGVSNYLLGSDPGGWHTGIPNYAAVAYRGVYAGIDLLYHGNGRQLEYDFRVAAGADPGQVRLGFAGAEGLSLDGPGDLVLQTAAGAVVEQAPVLYQEGGGGTRQAVSGGYVLEGDGTVGFRVGAYDRSRPLVIDPTLVYSTYLGGSGDDAALGIAVDGSGNAYVTGTTFSRDFPTTAGAFQTAGGFEDAFVAKLDAAGSALVYSTYLGGRGQALGYGIAVDGSGNAYVTGFTNGDFPTTAGAFQTAPGGVPDAFVAKLDAAGTALLYSTYLGGSGADQGYGIAVDGSGNAYVTGFTNSSNFPTTAGALQTSLPGITNAFVAKLDAAGTALLYSTYLGGSNLDAALGIAVDGSGNAYVTGSTRSTDFPTTAGAFQTSLPGRENAFVAKLDAAGTALVYSTYLGGSSFDAARGIAVDGSGNAYVTGSTFSRDFPTTAGALQTSYGGGGSDAFVAKLDAAGTALLYSTYLGGSTGSGIDEPLTDLGNGIAVDGSGNAYVTGYTESTDFPTTAGAFQTAPGGGVDAFVAKLDAAGTALLYSTYLGGSFRDVGSGIAVGGSGNAYVTGGTDSRDFPTTAGAFQTSFGGIEDAFVAKLDTGDPEESDTVGVFDPATATWYLRGANSAGPPAAGQFQYGGAGWLPVTGDWDGRGSVGVGAFDPATATWYLRFQASAGSPDAGTFLYGGDGWGPVSGDWHNSGHTGIGAYDPATATWYLRNDPDAGPPDAGTFQFGVAGGIPVVGDWTGTGHLGIGVFDPATATWYLRSSLSAGAPDVGVFRFGGVGWRPVVGDWDGSGHAGIGVFDPSTAIFYLRTEPGAGAPGAGQFQYGGTGWLPVSGPFAPLQDLLAAGGEGPGGAAPLSADQLQAAVSGALARLSAAGADPGLVQALGSASYGVGQLPPGVLGETDVATRQVLLSADAAGYGWFVDGTPLQDEEFAPGAPGSPLVALPGSAAAGKEDLLTAVLHEMGHLAGSPDGGAGLMEGALTLGTRNLGALDQVFAAPGALAL